MHIGKSTDYVLSFQAKGIPFLMSDLFARGYDGVDVLDTWKDGVWSEYFTMEACEAHGQAGLTLFGDTSRFEEYVTRLDSVQANCEHHAKGLLTKAEISQAALSRLFDLWIEFLQLYFCMGIEYTELAVQQTNNPIVSTNLEKLQGRKNPTREYLNQSCVNEDSYLSTILKRLGERFTVTVEELWQYTIEEILDLFAQKRVAPETVQARAYAAILQVQHKTFNYTWGEEALHILKTFEEAPPEGGILLSGKVAHPHPTTVRGYVTIIDLDYQDFAGMNAKMDAMPRGAVLIAQSTAPELMLAIKKAAAIVTDMGGLMSHAAIVSRELNIPCLVGTRHATKTFKDGDLVEVDAQTGTIRRVT